MNTSFSDPNHDIPYRAVSKAAVASLVLALLGVAGVLVWQFLIMPLVGVVLGIVGMSNLWKYPNELTGKPAAILGIILGLLLVVGGGAWHVFVYFTEVPDGYVRISFYDLQPTKTEVSWGMPISEKALELNGKEVFVKGYVYPDGQSQGIKRFILIPDLDTCCFGGQPSLTDMIEVTLRDPHRISYSYTCRRLGGVLRVSPHKKEIAGLDGVYYQLDADYVK
ncbi:MAG: hypothetical protein ACI9G1_002906 [Pirellulaceae bacterium]|jgi:hypothetical protein